MVGLIAKILSVVGIDVELDPGGGDNVTAQHSAPAGVDSQPLLSDSAVAVPVPGTGRFVVVGYFDPDNDPKAGPGEYRAYARDEDGAEVAQVWLKSDGSIEAQNAAGNFSLQSDGTFSVNGVTISPDGKITTPTGIDSPSIVANGKELAVHAHNAGTPPGTTGPNI